MTNPVLQELTYEEALSTIGGSVNPYNRPMYNSSLPPQRGDPAIGQPYNNNRIQGYPSLSCLSLIAPFMEGFLGGLGSMDPYSPFIMAGAYPGVMDPIYGLGTMAGMGLMNGLGAMAGMG
jgi:hypothetical protein